MVKFNKKFKSFLIMVLSFAVFAGSSVTPVSIQAEEEVTGPVVILKLDDLHTGNVEEFQRVVDIITADPELRASFGIIGDFTTTWGESHSWKNASNELYDRVALWHSQGIEIWHHGSEHARHYYDDTQATYWTESEGANYAYQLDAFKTTFDLVKEKMGITIHSVGCTYNNNDEIFLKMLEKEFPEITTIMFPDYSESLPETITHLSNSIVIEQGTGNLNSIDQFKSDFQTVLDGNYEYCILQGHAAEWDDTEIATFKEYITYLKSINAVFMTPYEYTNYISGTAQKLVYSEVNSSLVNNPVSDTFTLPTTVEGSDISISWSCPDSSINISGNQATVTKYEYYDSYYTTLIATITDGDTVTSKEVPVRVVHHNAPVTPNDDELLYYDNFDTNGIQKGVMLTDTTGTYTHAFENGKMLLKRDESLDGTSTNSLLRWYFKDKWSGWKGKVVVEYDVYTDNTGGYSLEINYRGTRLSVIRLYSNYISAYNGSSETKISGDIERTNAAAPLNLKILHDFDNATYSVWANDKLLAFDFAFRATNTSMNANNLYCFATTFYANTLYIDNFKIYEANNDIFAGLSDSMSTYASTEQGSSVSLPVALPDDSTAAITWSAKTANASVSGTTANFELSHYETTIAELTAAVEIDGIKYTKDYTVSLALDTTPTPEVDEYGEPIYNTNIDFSNYDTSSISTKHSTVALSDGSLVINAATPSGEDGNVMIKLNSGMPVAGYQPVFEFDITRSSADSVHLQPTNRSATAGRFVGVRMTGSQIDVETTGGTFSTVKSDYGKIGTSSHVIIKMSQTSDKTNAVASLWVDGVQLAVNMPTWKSTQVDVLKYLKIVINKNTTTTITIDNFKSYYAAVVPNTEVDDTISAIKAAGLSSVVSSSDGNTCLGFAYDAGNSSVTFSDTEGLVNADGSINMPFFDTDTTLTVTVEQNDYAKSITFDATIAGKLNIGAVTYSPQAITVGSNNSLITAYTRSSDISSIEFITAYYNIDGEMLSVAADTLPLESKSDGDNTYTITATVESDEAVIRKSFVLDSMTALVPLTKSETLTLPNFFHDDMILQRGEPVDIWGIAAPNENVRVTFGTKTKDVTSGSDGAFCATLDSMEADSAGKILTIRTNSAIRTFDNVVVGDIWLVSGQSNAEYNLQWFADYYDDDNIRADIANASHSDIRYMKVGYKDINLNTAGPVLSEYEMKLDVNWTQITPEVAAYKLSALGYYFAKNLQPEVDIPIGIICAAKGGKTISQFLPSSLTSSKQAAVVYNEMLAPLSGLKIKGVVWWQGEQDYSSNKMRQLIGDLADTFRTDFDNEQLPFYYVQLQRFSQQLSGGTIKNYKSLREQMRRYEKYDDEYAHMACIIDLGSTDAPGENHPSGKDIAGERVACLARYYTYGQTDIVPSGPSLRDDDITISGANMMLTFDHVGSGLTIRNSDKLSGFELAGSDKLFHTADAAITANNQITVTSSEVASPVYVRYIYDAFPEPVTLFNSEGLPASPFATDNPSWVEETALTTE